MMHEDYEAKKKRKDNKKCLLFSLISFILLKLSFRLFLLPISIPECSRNISTSLSHTS